MSHKMSGLWCDICEKPIIDGEWWHIGLTDRETGTQIAGHGCAKCKNKLDEKADEQSDEGQ